MNFSEYSKVKNVDKSLYDFPNKVDLNEDFELNENTKPVYSEQLVPNQHLIKTHKYPFIKNEIISIDDLRSKVYRSSIGVLPLRQSQEIDDLRIVLKGKSLKDFHNYQTDIDESIYSKHQTENIHANTPTMQTFEITTPRFDSSSIIDNKLPKTNSKRPAILPKLGTAGAAKINERPKQSKEEIISTYGNKLSQENRNKFVKKMKKHDEISVQNDIEVNQEDYYKFNEMDVVQSLIEEAKEISNKKRKANEINKKSILLKKQSNDSLINSGATVTNEKLLLKSVEGLIGAIKSGELLEEQKKADLRIQTILNKVLNKKEDEIKLENLLDSNEKENEICTVEDEKSSIISINQDDDKLDKTEEPLLDNQIEANKENKLNQSDTISINSKYIDKEEDLLHTKQMSDSGKDNLFSNTQLELSKLPEIVTNEDIINAYSKKKGLHLRRQQKSTVSVENEFFKDIKKIENKQENKLERNLHKFCIFNNESHGQYLLPKELRDATRKYHSNKRFKESESSILHSSKVFDGNLEDSKLSIISSTQSAERVFKNLKMASNTNNSNDLESWKQRAKKLLNSEFIFEADPLTATNRIVDEDDFLLNFLRPAPPKMSMKIEIVKNHLFPHYESIQPRHEIIIGDSKIKVNKQFSKLNFETTDKIDEEEIDIETKLITEKLLTRRYHSDLTLDKEIQLKDSIKLIGRSLSDSNLFYKDNGDTKFVQIDTNYNDAIEEAVIQKNQIKEQHSKLIENEKLSYKNGSEMNHSASISKDTKITSENVDSQENEIKTITFKEKYRTVAELALEEGRKYGDKVSKNRKDEKTMLYKKKINKKIIEEVQNILFNCQTEKIAGIKSEEDLKLNRDLPTEIEFCNISKKRQNSLTDILDFNLYKEKNNFMLFKPSKIYDDENIDYEREWVREIWNVWFDEVIPPLENNLDNDLNVENEFFNGEETNKSSKLLNFSPDDDSEGMNPQSPTPYDIYEKIDISNGKNLDANVLKEVQTEIDLLTSRINNKLNVFDLGRRGALYRKVGLIKLALNDLNQAISMEANYVDAYWQRHLVYITQNLKDKAVDDLNTILKINRTHAGAYLSRGDICAERKDTSMAIVNYSQAIKYNPNDYKGFYKRAKMYEVRGELRMAMDDYLTTTKLNPKIVDAWFKHGMNYYKNNNWQYAIVDFTELLKHNTNQSDARLYRGICYLNLEEYQSAFNDFSIAIHLDPLNWRAYYHRGCLLRKLDKTFALKDLSVSLLIENGYENINAYLHRAILYSENQNYEDAIKDYESVLQLDKEFAPAYVNLGIIYMNIMLNHWRAISYFNSAIKSNPVYLRAYLCRAQAYRNVRNLKQAYIDYTKAIHMDPLNTKIYICRGQVILEMGNLSLAAFCVQHAAFLNDDKKVSKENYDLSRNNISEQDQTVTQKAVVYSFLKNFSKAINVLENELKMKPEKKTYNLLGKIYMDAKMWNEACGTFQKSIDFNRVNMSSQGQRNFGIVQSQNIKDAAGNHIDLIESYFMKGQCLIELNNYSEAYICFMRVIELQPTNAKAYYYRGLVNVHLNPSKCVQDFNRALAIEPKYFEAYLARATFYGLQSRYAKAILNCNEALKINPKCVRGYLYRGALKYYSKAYLYAISDLTIAIKLQNTGVLAYYNRALCYQQLKRYNEALKDYSIVLLLGDYLKFKVCINRGLLYYNLNDYSNALSDFKIASEFKPNDYKIKHIVGLCYHKLGRLNEAVEILTKTVKMNNYYSEALISRGNVFVDYGHDIGFRKAKADYEHVLIKNPCDLDARINLAYLLQITGKFMQSWRQFTSAIAINPNFAASYEGRAIVSLQMSNVDAALKDINIAIKLSPSAQTFVNRGVIYQFIGDNISAMRDYQSAILIQPKYPLSYFNSANIFLLHKQFHQAIENYNIAIEKCNLDDETVYQNRGIAKVLLNRHIEALEDFNKALKHSKYSAHIYMNRGLLWYKLKDFKSAENDITIAIELAGQDPLLYKIRGDCRMKLHMNGEAMEDYKTAIHLKDN